MNQPIPHSQALLLLSLLLISISLVSPRPHAVPVPGSSDTGINTNPFTSRAWLLRYWANHVTNSLPIPSFLLSKASPLTAVDAAAFSKLASRGSLSSHLPSFCAAADLLCFPDLREAQTSNRGRDPNFALYLSRNFTNYGTKNYSDIEGIPVDTFRRYGSDSVRREEGFTSYATGDNVVDQRIHTFGSGATSGKVRFDLYNDEVNVPGLNFNNSGSEGNGEPNEFNSYGNNSNVVGSTFGNYGEGGNGAVDNFTSYGDNGNVPENNFRSYGDRGNTTVDAFTSYRDQSNDSFTFYAKNSASPPTVTFANYKKSFNEETDKFTGYGQVQKGTSSVSRSMESNANGSRISFAKYTNATGAAAESSLAGGQRRVTNRWFEPGKFFRESALEEGMLMPMPDIRDKMPRRSFLPRTILSKLPFATAKIAEMKELFHADDNSSLARIMMDALGECERAPSAGETKRCVGSIEDMVDFATSVLGKNIVVRTTENVEGSGRQVMIGKVKGIDGGKVTESMSCHQNLFPYLLYNCHSVPKVRVYEADILDPRSKTRINHGTAICHIDTSAWSATHEAFLALGSGPGRIEVCHWIFQNDMTWTVPS